MTTGLSVLCCVADIRGGALLNAGRGTMITAVGGAASDSDTRPIERAQPDLTAGWKRPGLELAVRLHSMRRLESQALQRGRRVPFSSSKTRPREVPSCRKTSADAHGQPNQNCWNEQTAGHSRQASRRGDDAGAWHGCEAAEFEATCKGCGREMSAQPSMAATPCKLLLCFICTPKRIQHVGSRALCYR